MFLASMLGWTGVEVAMLHSFMLAGLAFWVWMLVDCIRSEALSDNERIVWTVVIVFMHVLGAGVYLLAGRKRTSSAPLS